MDGAGPKLPDPAGKAHRPSAPGLSPLTRVGSGPGCAPPADGIPLGRRPLRAGVGAPITAVPRIAPAAASPSLPRVTVTHGWCSNEEEEGGPTSSAPGWWSTPSAPASSLHVAKAFNPRPRSDEVRGGGVPRWPAAGGPHRGHRCPQRRLGDGALESEPGRRAVQGSAGPDCPGEAPHGFGAPIHLS